jgi:phenylacetic acid degradation operon negative regulatory protein
VELRGGVWGRPDNLPAEATPPAAASVLAAQTTRWTATPVPGQEPPVAALFDLAPIARRTGELDVALRRVTAGLATGDLDLLGDGFRLGAAALQQIRRDPLLPPELAGDDWPGPALRRAYAGFQEVFSAAVGDWFARSAPDA